MIDGNISMEEDTELRDLVVQTLENNGVLAKVRAELRASVFLALEEQESVMNPEPLLNKSMKQYLANSQGKLLFSLVREFLEYFGLDYTISVYDPETYLGKEYNYVGRNKLCEELGINTNEPLLGEILKNGINSALNRTRKKNKDDNKYCETDDTLDNFANTTYDISIPKVLHESISLSNDVDTSEDANTPNQSSKIPINVTITDKKKHYDTNQIVTADSPINEKEDHSLRENVIIDENIEMENEVSQQNNNIDFNKLSETPSGTDGTNNTTQETVIKSLNQNTFNPELSINTEILNKFDESLPEMPFNQNQEVCKQNSRNSTETQLFNKVQNMKTVNKENSYGKTVFFDEIIIDGKKENVGLKNKQSNLKEVSTVDHKNNSIFGDLPPLNGKKTNLSDLRELMNMGLASDGVDNYEEDFVSSTSGSANEQSPSKDIDKLETLSTLGRKEDKTHSTRSEEISEDIEDADDLLSNTSCLEEVNIDKDESNFTTRLKTDRMKDG